VPASGRPGAPGLARAVACFMLVGMGGSSKHKPGLIVLAVALLGLAPAAPAKPRGASADASIWQQVDFGRRKPAFTLRHGGVEVEVEVPPPSEEESRATARIRIAGYEPLSIREREPGGQYPRQIGIGRLAAGDPVPSVLLQMYTGGAHCCGAITAVVPVGGRLRAVELPARDGEGLAAFPRDADGDGMVHFVWADSRFLYAFSSYAGSLPPPRIFNIVAGELVDVSTRPAFAPLFEKAEAAAKAICADRAARDRNGACAGYVAAAARLGRFDGAIAEVETLADNSPGIELATQCKVELVDYECPPGKENRFETFTSALRWFLQQNGYVPAPAAAALAACPSERAVYRLKGDPTYSATLVPARHHASAVSQLYLRVASPARSWWFTFGATQGYGGLFLDPVTDPTAPAAAPDGPRKLVQAEREYPISFYPMTRSLDVLDVAPQAQQPAPEAFFIPHLGPMLWYNPVALSGDRNAKAETMPRSLFIQSECRPNPPTAAYP
jgi:hypothetical protein